MGRKLRYLGPSERAEIERLYNGGRSGGGGCRESRVSCSHDLQRTPERGYTETVDEYGCYTVKALDDNTLTALHV